MCTAEAQHWPGGVRVCGIHCNCSLKIHFTNVCKSILIYAINIKAMLCSGDLGCDNKTTK